MAEPLHYYFDEHIPTAIAEQLGARGIDVLTTVGAGRANQEIGDDDQLTYAARMDRMLVTEDNNSSHSTLRSSRMLASSTSR